MLAFAVGISESAGSRRAQLRECDWGLSCAARLQACLNMPARLGGDDATLRGVILLCANHFQIKRAAVVVFMQRPDVADQVYVAPCRLPASPAFPVRARVLCSREYVRVLRER